MANFGARGPYADFDESSEPDVSRSAAVRPGGVVEPQPVPSASVVVTDAASSRAGRRTVVRTGFDAAFVARRLAVGAGLGLVGALMVAHGLGLVGAPASSAPVREEPAAASAGSEAGASEATKSESTKSDATKSESGRSDVSRSGTSETGATKSDGVGAEATKSDATKSEAVRSEAAASGPSPKVEPEPSAADASRAGVAGAGAVASESVASDSVAEDASVAGSVSVPGSRGEFLGMHYSDVAYAFEKAGFTNVVVEADHDLVTGWLHDDGDVEDVVVDGSKRYSKGDAFASDVRVHVIYHTY